MLNDTELTHSLEDYIEAIFNIISEKKVARAKDLKRKLKVNGASVTGALRTLAKKSLIKYKPYEVITLTPKGRKVATIIAKKHSIIKKFLVKVFDIPSFDAEEVACRIEHNLTPTVTIRFAAFVELFEKDHALRKACKDSFKKFLITFEDKTLNKCFKRDEVKRIESS